MLRVWREFEPFRRLLRRHWKQMALGSLCGLLAIACGGGLMALSGWFIAATAYAGLTVASAQLFNFFYPSIGVRFLAIGRTLARYCERIVSHDATFRVLASLRTWFYRRLEPLAPGCLMRYHSADILNRIVADINALDNLFLRVLSPSIVALVMFALVVGFLWIFDGSIALLTALFMVLAGAVVPLAALKLGAPRGLELSRRISDLRIMIVDGIQGLAELQAFGADRRHLERIRQRNRDLLECQRHMSHIRGLTAAAMTVITGLAVLTALYLGVLRMTPGLLDGVDLALVALTVLAAFEAILPLPFAYQYFSRTREAGRRLREIVSIAPAVDFPERSRSASPHFGLKFEDVGFRYRDGAPLAVSDVNFEIPAGRRAAIIGETGSGKSTLIHLLARFQNPDSGRILLGNADVGSFSEADLRRYISVVTQHPHMFNATLKENLLLARPGASEDQLLAALESAQLLDFVKALPEGLNTWIGEAGKLLSGGQAQRVAVARSILHDAAVWVLDEPTEDLDSVTAEKLMQAIERQTVGRTVLLITHRLADLPWMDQIVMFDRGRVIARGTHAELIECNPRYAAWQLRIPEL